MCVCVCSSEFDYRLLFPYYFGHFDVRVKLALRIEFLKALLVFL